MISFTQRFANLQYNGVLMQEITTGKHEEIKAAVKEVAEERDTLKTKVSSLTDKVTSVESQLQQVAEEKKNIGQQLAASKKQNAKVRAMHSCTTADPVIGVCDLTLQFDGTLPAHA